MLIAGVRKKLITLLLLFATTLNQKVEKPSNRGAISVGLFSRIQPDSKRKGHISESAIVTKFLQCGCVVLIPYGGSERYDLVIEDTKGIFLRIQCKSGWIENGAVYFDTANHNVTGTKRDWRHYRGQCDYFAVYCAELDQVYLVPVDEVGKTRAHLRIEPTKNKQEKNVRWAKDYEL